MLIDAKLLLSDGQGTGTSAGTVPSTNVIDTHGGLAKDAFGSSLSSTDPGGGFSPFYFNVEVEGAPAGGTSIEIVLQDSADNSSYATILSFGAKASTSYPVGTRLAATVPPNARRYLRAAYIITGTLTTQATLNAFLAAYPAA